MFSRSDISSSTVQLAWPTVLDCGQVEHDAYAVLVPGDVCFATILGKKNRAEAESRNHS
jgi:hypothetical protein